MCDTAQEDALACVRGSGADVLLQDIRPLLEQVHAAQEDGANGGSSSSSGSNPAPVSVCATGGAAGADAVWTACAAHAGHVVFQMSFRDHRVCTDAAMPSADRRRVKRVVLSPDELAEAEEMVAGAAKRLQRGGRMSSWSKYTRNLILRNWWQVRNAYAAYAVGTRARSGRDDSVCVDGGTAWACQMFVDRWCAAQRAEKPGKQWWHAAGATWRKVPLYVYFMGPADRGWHQAQVRLADKHAVRWKPIDMPPPPPPEGVYAAIGSRDLDGDARNAIVAFMEGASG